MMDHEGLVKEIVWTAGSLDAEGRNVIIAPEVHAYTPECAPERLLHHHLTYTLPRVLEVAVLTLALGWLLHLTVTSLLVRLPKRVADTPRERPRAKGGGGEDGAEIVVVDFPPVPLEHPLACSVSPFASKVELLLRFSGINYTKRVGAPGSQSPKGQIPWVERGGRLIGDSNCVLLHLEAAGDVGAALPRDPRDAATAAAIRSLSDNDLNAALVYYRWLEPQNWARNRGLLLRGYRLPRLVEALVVRLARKGAYVRCWEHGLARHSEADRVALIRGWLAALAGLLAGRPACSWLFGARPCAADAAVWGMLDQFACQELNPQLTELLAEQPSLVAYHARIRAQFFPEAGDSGGRGEAGGSASGGGAGAVAVRGPAARGARRRKVE
eukprot:scaffold17.g541.t1